MTDKDYEWVLQQVETFHRAETLEDLQRLVLSAGERLAAKGWLEADAAGRWLPCRAGEPAPWSTAALSPAPANRTKIVWRNAGCHALALGWSAERERWVGWWMSPAPAAGEPLAQRLMPALLTAYERTMAEEHPGPTNGEVRLTAREREVARWIAEGKTDMEIGRILSISESTVGKHRDNIYAKVGVATRSALTRWVLASR